MSEVGTALVVVAVVTGGVCAVIVSIYRKHLVSKGMAAYLVKIAASGNGKTYHTPGCTKCRSGILLTIEEARSRYYAPCASCGGRPGFCRTIR